MIDPSTGDVSFEYPAIRVGPDFTATDFQRSPLGTPLEDLFAHPVDARLSLRGRRYQWGEARSLYDTKSGFSGISIVDTILA